MIILNYLTVLIQRQIFMIILSTTKKYHALLTNHPIHIYINMINKRLVFKIREADKLELEAPEKMTIFGSK